MEVLQVLVLLLVSVASSECVRCFARFDLTSGQCHEELGEVDEDDCCQNTQYGYQATDDGECQSCGPQVWSPWSPWSPCNVLCGEGVRQRSRACFGIGQSDCSDISDKLQTEPCSGTCCDAKGWGPWGSWSPCSVTCGAGGVRRRVRVCSSPPECGSACGGPSEEREDCPAGHTCPVHGSWSRWSDWSECSGSCVDDQGGEAAPSKVRYRTCSSPAPSNDTVPPGNGCPGDAIQATHCSELPNCPVDGSWGAWSRPGPCSASCGEGLQLSTRTCSQPVPRYGGRGCEGPSARSSTCQSPCPVDGFWSGWSSWSDCSSSCIPQGRAAARTRHRSCSNPAPSSSPPGRACQGDARQAESCDRLAHCPVDGGWGSWSPFTSCPVTCGVGLQESVRRCDSPAPQHGGRPCPGTGRQTRICTTNVHCPVDGAWSEWSPWSQCLSAFGGKNIRCKQNVGRQSQDRQCLHQAHNGSACSAGSLSNIRVCYDVDNCYLKGSWDGWEPWSLCKPPCGEKSRRFRRRFCKPDYSDYRLTPNRRGDVATFFGTPRADCGPAPDGGDKIQIQPCANAPACPGQP